MSFALAAKMFEDKVPLKVTGVATAVLGAIVVRKDAGISKLEDLKGRKMAAIVGTHGLPGHADPRAEGARARPPEGHADRHRDRRSPTW